MWVGPSGRVGGVALWACGRCGPLGVWVGPSGRVGGVALWACGRWGPLEGVGWWCALDLLDPPPAPRRASPRRHALTVELGAVEAVVLVAPWREELVAAEGVSGLVVVHAERGRRVVRVRDACE